MTRWDVAGIVREPKVSTSGRGCLHRHLGAPRLATRGSSEDRTDGVERCLALIAAASGNVRTSLERPGFRCFEKMPGLSPC